MYPLGWAGLGALLVAVVAIALSSGAVDIPVSQLIGLDSLGAREERVLYAIRLPRVVLGLAVGASLAVSGALLQSMFRNPLASPSILGLATGGSLGAAVAIVMGLPGIWLPLSAFVACLVSIGVVLVLGRARGDLDTTSMILAGIAVNAIAGAGTGLVVFLSDDAQLRALTFFTLGSLGGATWAQLTPALPLILLPIAAISVLPGRLNALMLGEAEARHLGVDVVRVKRMVVVLVAAGVGACVAVSGVIAFVGLAVPHLVRLAGGPDNRIVLPASALLGASLLVAGDTVARTVVAPAELPIGILTTLLGGPFFVWLLARRKA